ncbi:Bug family tripartite tricarboxylate transporter substrate binding protein [Plastoroseomonas hellenica]|uniref:Bug family tripartite tricarboxylate transporter substrate binding protein n=1 Tax=Plastoroseomonas hellenica TaxID=2687306 RepID=UPI001BAE3A46|nr:tripartite tricarboxylate transporter substrate binding protein [Plastoroseomonas hellenica]MBR0643798.1 tripartite tricarboxylate transporter substrate binding protein [Plastoroseomonas hellenica]
MIHRRTMLAALPAVALAGTTRAQEPWPQRPIRIIVGFAAGGATDITTRTLAPKLQSLLGQSIIVDNRPGAGGNLATELVVRAQPDGYTLLMGTIGALAINPTLYGNLTFDPQADLTPIAMAGDILNILVVPTDRPWRTVADLIAAARAQPDTLTYGSSGIGGAGHLAGALLDQEARIRTIHVPYRGGGPLMTDLISGKIDFAFSTAPTALPQIEGGKLRALAVPTARRSAITGALPAVSETLPGFEVANWYALLGPKALPPAITARLNAAMQETLRDPEMVAHLARHGTEPRPGPPEELARFIRQETEKWAPIVRATGANPN